MPGIHAIFKQKSLSVPIKINDFDELLYNKKLGLKILDRDRNYLIGMSVYPDYPYRVWEDRGTQIVLEGAVYNYSEKELFQKLRHINQLFLKGKNYRDYLKEFVRATDGDYLILFWHKDQNKVLLFNDALGRLPLYYYLDSDMIVFGKEIKTVLKFIPKIILHKTSLVEYLVLEYPLGDRTFFENIFRLQPSSAICSEDFHSEVFQSAPFDFQQKNVFKTELASRQFLSRTYLSALKNRITYFKKKNYKLLVDLSGGFDTRTILGGFKVLDEAADYSTFEYVRDESDIAESLFKNIHAKGSYRKLQFNHRVDMQKLGQLIFQTEGLVNYYTTSICHQDALSMESASPAKAVRFSGLGGEFIRHPFKAKFLSLPKMIRIGWYSALNLRTACRMVGLNMRDYTKYLKKHFAAYPEKNSDDRLKRFYYEYYLNYVGSSAEERERINFWTVQPLWSKDFILAIFHRVPLDWANYEYYTQFLKTINPDLLETPIYGSNMDLHSPESLRKKASREFLHDLYHFVVWKKIVGNLRGIVRIYKNVFHIKVPSQDILGKSDQWIPVYLKKLKFFHQVFDSTSLLSGYGGIYDARILTLLIYLREIEKRYGDKICF